MRIGKIEFRVGRERVVGVLNRPDKQIGKAVLLIHGFGGSKDEWSRFVLAAHALAESGIAALRIDCRGTGESGGGWKNFVKATVDSEVQDALAAITWMKRKLKARRIGILGLSLGGTVATLAAARKPEEINAMVLWAPALYTQDVFKDLLTVREAALLKKRGWIWQKKRWGFLKVGRPMFENIATLNMPNKLSELKIPIKIVHGDKDDVVPIKYSKRALKLLWKGKLSIIRGADHGFYEPTQTKCLIDESIAWFKKYL